MVKSLSENYSHLEGNSLKMPTIITIGKQSDRTIHISTYGETARRLTALGIPSKVSNSARETFKIQDENLGRFYLATLEAKPKLSWTFGLLDIKKTKENQKKEGSIKQEHNVYRVKDINQDIACDSFVNQEYLNTWDFTESMKSKFNPFENNNTHYQNIGSIQILAIFYMNDKQVLNFVGIGLNSLSSAKTIFCTKPVTNNKYSAISFEQGRAYKCKLDTIDFQANGYKVTQTYLTQKDSVELESAVLQEATEEWDIFYDEYTQWQDALVKIFKGIIGDKVVKENSSALPNTSRVVSRPVDYDFDDEIPDFDVAPIVNDKPW